VIVVTGADGQLGTAFRNAIPEASVFLNRTDLDLTDLALISPTITALEPTMVINCAAYTAVDAAESDEETANVVNGYAVGELAGVCSEVGARFVTFSTDYVFDGFKEGEYVESDPPNPINAYGRTKALGERLALEANRDSLVIRTSWLMSGTHRNFITAILGGLAQGDVTVVDGQFGKPTLADDLAVGTMQAVDNGSTGLLHLTNQGITTWFGLAQQVAEIAGYGQDRVHPCAVDEYETAARRPINSALGSERASHLLAPYGPTFSLAVLSHLQKRRSA
jgi:dTDP-4-dehydrorhamnose reductase